MSVVNLEIPGVWVFTPKQWSDDRGTFFEWFQDSTFREQAGIDFSIAQANCSISKKGTLRGLHFADVPPGQRKYVTCFSGKALDVVVDLRVGSPTFKKWEFIELNTISRKVVSIPNGVGHGFMALENNTTVVYLCDQRYNPLGEREVNPLDSEIGIDWPLDYDVLISAKDENAPSLASLDFNLPNYNVG